MSGTIDTEELREAIRGVLSDRSGGAIDIPGDEGRGLDRALWGEMAALGWLGMIVPEAQGGLGLGLSHLAVLYEELGRELASAPVLPTMLAAAAIARHAGAQVQARWLPAMAAGECLAAFALPGDASLPLLDAQGMLAGEVDHVLFADCAGLLALPVRTGEGTAALALIPADAAGVTVTRRPLVDLTRSAARVTLDGVRVEAGHLLALAGADWSALLDHAAMALACDAAGGAEALLERTVDYLCMREQFGRPIGSFQALKHRAADWKVRIEAMRALARHAAALVEAGAEDASAMASGAKAHGCDVYAAFAGDAVQLHGGIGFTWEHPCHLFLKRAKLSQQLFGGPAAHRDRAARLMIG